MSGYLRLCCCKVILLSGLFANLLQIASNLDLYRFHDLETIENHLKHLSKQYHDQVALASLGTTYEGRKIRVLTIVDDEKERSDDEERKNDSIFIDCGIHAREWISHAFCLYLLHKILIEEDPEFLLSNSLVLYVVPVLNPDGYAYSWLPKQSANLESINSDEILDLRMWRKNRRPLNIKEDLHPNVTQEDICKGVDINRNFELSGKVEMRSVCEESYSGPRPFSEKESKALKRGITEARQKTNVIGYISIHCCIQKLFMPYGISWKKPRNEDDLLKVLKVGHDAIAAVGGPKYEYEQAKFHKSNTTGTSLDWVYDPNGGGVDLSILVEIAGNLNGTNRFLTEDGDRLKTGLEQVYAGVAAMIKEIKRIVNMKRTKT